MKSTKDFMKEFYSRKFEITVKEKNGEVVTTIQQTQRNDARAEFLNCFLHDLQEIFTEIDVKMTTDGITFGLQHEEYGSIAYAIDVTTKPLEYDIYKAAEDYQIDQAEKIVKREKRLADRAIKFKNDTEAREIKAKKKGI